MEKTWRRSERRLHTEHGGGNVLVWGCFSKNGVGELVGVMGIMTGDSYINILKENLQKSAEKMGMTTFVLQQDNDSKHKCRVAAEFMRSGHRMRILVPSSLVAPQTIKLLPPNFTVFVVYFGIYLDPCIVFFLKTVQSCIRH